MSGQSLSWGAGVPHPQDMIPPDSCTVLFLLTGHAHLTDFNIATIIKDGERATALGRDQAVHG